MSAREPMSLLGQPLSQIGACFRRRATRPALPGGLAPTSRSNHHPPGIEGRGGWSGSADQQMLRDHARASSSASPPDPANRRADHLRSRRPRRESLFATMRELKSNGTTMMFVSHKSRRGAEEIADFVHRLSRRSESRARLPAAGLDQARPRSRHDRPRPEVEPGPKTPYAQRQGAPAPPCRQRA